MKIFHKFLVLFIVLLFNAQLIFPQWVQTNGPGGADCFAVSGTNLFAGSYGNGVYLSTNNGTSWTAVNNGVTNSNVLSLAVIGTNLFAGTDGGGVYRSTNNGTSWISVNNGLATYSGVTAFAVNGTNLFATEIYDGGVYLSTNNGTSWNAAGLTKLSVMALAVSGTNLFAGATDSVYLSTNNGTSWHGISNGLTTFYGISALAVNGTNLFAGLPGGGVYLSTNNGISWNAINNGLTNSFIYALAVSGTNIFAGTGGGGVYLSTNKGTSWTAVNNGLTDSLVSAVAVVGTNIFAGGSSCVWKRPLSELLPVELTSFTASSNKNIVNLNWHTATETNNRGFEIQRKVDDNNWVVIGFRNGNGTTTNANNYSFTDDIAALNVNKLSYRLRQVDFNGQFQYSPVVLVDNIFPVNYSISQNFPNPFNPSSVIKYQIPQNSFVNIKVFNSLGQTVKILENGFKNAGSYSITFNATELPSGTYYYKIEAGQFSQTKKMILLK